MEKAQKDYQQLHELAKHARVLQGIASLLDWDQETYMPQGAAAIRAEQLKTMAGLVHREKTSRKFTNALAKLVDIKTGQILAKDLTSEQAAAVREWRRDYIQDTALPTKFVEEFAKLTSQSILVWRNAKKENAFMQFAPYLDRIVSMNRKKAEYLGYKDHPYDALLDQYEPDVKTKEVNQLFSQLRDALTPLIKKMAHQPIDDQFLFGNWDHAKQMAFSHQILEAMGYDFDKGRLDFSSHPFSSSSHPTDSRITTRIHPTSLMSNIFVILHEGGHALYEMGLSTDLYGTPLGDARSLGVHESQSRWWETRIGLSRPFWQHFLPLLKKTFNGQLESITLDQFYRAINKVEPSFIRVEADEVTYPLHVILRFELEKALIEGSLSVRDVPEAWNAKMNEYLEITPSDNREGCLQDIHWAMGAFGYFPTYTLGNLYAAHLFDAFAKELPDWEKRVAAGELLFIKEWLQDKIYQHGRRFATQELLKQATGKAFSADAYITYLKDKYAKIYSLS
ncbi:carboxypeptidase M32 [Candidatus Protochlamydia phocaeensis]|uniref:carboxypeptidase M32 n=1 Tax=Candidatus Protochlamydia phocaeensis TaxID=1414722 RepID=UPI0008397C54|nr:carboxypeptidase M32 [Candidatus Protochlamydia phocaeensis]